MEQTRVTTKIKQHSLRKLKILAALTGKSMIDVLERLIDAELVRVQQKKEDADTVGESGLSGGTGPQ